MRIRIDKITIEGHWVSDGLGDDYKSWFNENKRLAGEVEKRIPQFPVFINAPTGRGKTEFVFNKLIPFTFEKYKKNVLIISNRLALNAQMKKSCLETVLQSEEAYLMETKDLLRKENFDTPKGRVSIITYQRARQFISDLTEDDLSSYYFVIMDEAHFFISDALFNNETHMIYHKITRSFKDAVRVYMSATFDEAIEPIFEGEEQLFAHIIEVNMQRRKGDALVYSEFKMYEFKPDYSNYKWYFYDDMSSIIKRIENDNSVEKWLIFVSSRTYGEQLAKGLLSKSSENHTLTKDNVKFIHARNRNDEKEIWDDIARRSEFPCKVLICTQVFDNGISIKDGKVKHIVLMPFDKVTTFQMIGRKRCDEDESVNVYIQDIDKNHLDGLIRSSNEKCKAIQEYKNPKSPEAFIRKYWNERLEGDPDVRKLFYMTPDKELILNNFAEVKLESLRRQYGEIRRRMTNEEDNVFARMVMEWTGLPESNIEWIDAQQAERAKEALMELVQEYTQKYTIHNREIESKEIALNKVKESTVIKESVFEDFCSRCIELGKMAITSKQCRVLKLNDKKEGKKAKVNRIFKNVLSLELRIEKRDKHFYFYEPKS